MRVLTAVSFPVFKCFVSSLRVFVPSYFMFLLTLLTSFPVNNFKVPLKFLFRG